MKHAGRLYGQSAYLAASLSKHKLSIFCWNIFYLYDWKWRRETVRRGGRGREERLETGVEFTVHIWRLLLEKLTRNWTLDTARSRIVHPWLSQRWLVFGDRGVQTLLNIYLSYACKLTWLRFFSFAYSRRLRGVIHLVNISWECILGVVSSR